MKQQYPFRPCILALAVAAALPAAHAADSDGLNQKTVGQQTLKEVKVSGSRRVGRKEKEVTGLGKIVKTADTLNKEQVLGIRDLTRYDPGVAVVEQGNGASSGFSIRGVDKNRVATSVDGIAQIQTYTIQGGHGGSGAINEIEYENIGRVEISKGASSSEYGSGSLGGAVGFRTKEAADFIRDGKSWGLTAKTAYGSKNRQWVNSIGAGFDHKGFEGLVQYTRRSGEETHPHKDAASSTVYDIERLGAYANEWDLREPDKRAESYFLVENECPALDCTPKPGASVTPDRIGRGSGAHAATPLSPAEQAQWQQSRNIRERVSAERYTGSERVLPNPLDYRSESWFSKLGYRFGERHYIGGVLENTQQRYDTRDMAYKSYYTPSESGQFDYSRGVYRGSDIEEGVYSAGNTRDTNGVGIKYSRARFIDEKHRKNRNGLTYRYEAPRFSDGLIDRAYVSWDKQDIRIDNTLTYLNCAVYPDIDKSCRASAGKPGSQDSSEHSRYREQHKLFQIGFDKAVKNSWTSHDLSLRLGYDNFRSTLTHDNYTSHYASTDWQHLRGNGTYANPYIYRNNGTTLVTADHCDNASFYRNCNPRIIDGSNRYLALSDNFSVGRYFDFSLGGRYDRYRFSSHDSWTASSSYGVHSWNTGIVFKPNRHVSLSYRTSSGFRVPSFQELFGYRLPGQEAGADDKYHYTTNVKPERARNRELGIQIKGNFGSLEASYFRNDYNGLISLTEKKGKVDGLDTIFIGYRNAQNIRLNGINLLGRIDWNGISSRLPEGLYTTLAYNRIKPKSVSTYPDLVWAQNYILDAVQPSRYIFGIGYDHPDDKWGVNATVTYSKGKDPSELAGKQVTASGNGDFEYTATNQRTGSWKTLDISGYYRIKKFLTLRAGAYNLGNYRYVTWEALRQTATGATNRHSSSGNYTRYAAPGRNFSLALEMKF